ncbi:MAG: hypothetical protein IJ308_01880 [Clostridia bacterium]|nr:hypothetical protein [Clostridia bacterium]
MRMKKCMSVLLGGVLLYSSLFATACGGQVEGSVEVEGKTTIQVAGYDAGLGLEWLKDAAKAFEAKYAKESFEEGKEGVAVVVSGCEGADMMITKNLNKDVYFTELFDYYSYVNKGLVADITSVVDDPLSAFGENTTVGAKMDQATKDFLTSKDGKYYALPFYDGFMGFVYDVDMFEENGYFFDEAGNFTGDPEQKSTGIDGKSGTWDDGLPKTYAQFEQLVNYIRDGGKITPFVYSAEGKDYFRKGLTNWWSDYEGKDYMLRNWNIEGETDYIEKFENGEPVIKTTAVNASNVNILQQQPGKYYALDFLKDVVCSNTDNYTSASDFKNAQYQFIAGEMGSEPVAMMMEGVWWEIEADLADSFTSISRNDIDYDATQGSYKSTRRFAFMPVPKVDDANLAKSNKQTLYSGNDAFCFISANSKGAKLDVAKLFLQFMHTDEQLSSFTAKMSITRSMNYQMKADDLEKMTYFGKSVMEMKSASDVVYPYSGHEYYISNSANFALGQWGWKATIGGRPVLNPFEEYLDHPNTTAQMYFEGLKAAH